jgi:hypothetical protein
VPQLLHLLEAEHPCLIFPQRNQIVLLISQFIFCVFGHNFVFRKEHLEHLLLNYIGFRPFGQSCVSLFNVVVNNLLDALVFVLKQYQLHICFVFVLRQSVILMFQPLCGESSQL